MAETYQQFKTRVTDGKNLVELDPAVINEATKNEPFAYVQKLRAEHKAAIMAKHKRVVKKPFVTSEIVQGEVSETPQTPPVVEESVPEPLLSSTSPQGYDPKHDLDMLRERNRESELIQRRRQVDMQEMVFAWIMGVFSGYGIYLVTKEVWSSVAKFLLNFFAK